MKLKFVAKLNKMAIIYVYMETSWHNQLSMHKQLNCSNNRSLDHTDSSMAINPASPQSVK